MRYVYFFLVVFFPSVSFALVPLVCPNGSATQYIVNNEICYSDEDCIKKYIQNYTIDRGKYIEIYTYNEGSATSTATSVTGSRTKSFSCKADDCGDISQTTIQTFSTGIARSCIDSPDPDPEADCSSKSTTDSIVAVFDGPNTFTLSGCFDDCSVSTERNDGGQGVTARTKNADGSYTSRAYYTGGSCSSESIATEAVNGETVTVSDVNADNNVLIQVPALEIAVEFPSSPDPSIDTESELNTATPVDNITDVISEVYEDDTATPSFDDNTELPVDPAEYPDKTEITVNSTDANGDKIQTTMIVNHNYSGSGSGGDGSTTGGTGGSGDGSGTGSGSGDGTADFDGVVTLDPSTDFGSAGRNVDLSGFTLADKTAELETDTETLKQELLSEFEIAKAQFSNLIQLNGGSGTCPSYAFDIPFYGTKVITPCVAETEFVWNLIRGLLLFIASFSAVLILFSRP